MYTLKYSSKAWKELAKLEKKDIERILIALERLRIRPESCDIKKLVGMDGYRFRVGDHRIIFDINKNELIILILKVGHRKNVYN
jgi:mRNA interferase RelE/StbE